MLMCQSVHFVCSRRNEEVLRISDNGGGVVGSVFGHYIARFGFVSRRGKKRIWPFMRTLFSHKAIVNQRVLCLYSHVSLISRSESVKTLGSIYSKENTLTTGIYTYIANNLETGYKERGRKFLIFHVFS